MDKLKINNQIVSMRKFVKQAKVHLINKLVKDVKHLQVKKGNEAQLEKHKRKMERLLSEIEILKKITPDSVSKMTLTNTKNWKEVLCDKKASLNDRSFAMLADYEPVQKEVRNFHCSNPNLMPKIPLLIQEWEARKIETPDNKTYRQMKASEIRERKKKDRFSRIKGKSKFMNRTPKPFNKQLNRENMYVKKNKVEDTNHASFEKPPVSTDSNEEKLNDSFQDTNLDREPKTQLTDDQTPKEISKSKKNVKVITALNLDELKDDDEICVQESVSDDDLNLSLDEEPTTDPFFLRENDVPCEKDKQNKVISDDDEYTGENKSQYSKRFNDKKTFVHNQGSSSNKFNNYRRDDDRRNRFSERKQNHGFNKANDFKNDTKFGGGRRGFKPFQEDKRQSSGSKFTKKFSTTKAENNLSSFKKRFGVKNISMQKSNDKGGWKEKPALHPSWEAKKRAKEAQQVAFQGKRVVFKD